MKEYREFIACDYPSCEITNEMTYSPAEDEDEMPYSFHTVRVAFGENRGRFPHFRRIDLCANHLFEIQMMMSHFSRRGTVVGAEE